MKSNTISPKNILCNQKGTVMATLLIVVLVSALAGGGVFLWQHGIVQEKEASHNDVLERLERDRTSIEDEKSRIHKELTLMNEKYRMLETKANKFEWDYIQVQEKYEAAVKKASQNTTALKDQSELIVVKKTFADEKKKYQAEIEALKKVTKENEKKQKDLEDQVARLIAQAEEIAKKAQSGIKEVAKAPVVTDAAALKGAQPIVDAAVSVGKDVKKDEVKTVPTVVTDAVALTGAEPIVDTVKKEVLTVKEDAKADVVNAATPKSEKSEPKESAVVAPVK